MASAWRRRQSAAGGQRPASASGTVSDTSGGPSSWATKLSAAWSGGEAISPCRNASSSAGERVSSASAPIQPAVAVRPPTAKASPNIAAGKRASRGFA
ncbi:hypothetical protein [Sphingopyxis sp. PET50]|uniref:hypothetical protein n=1 Tax=Sphingopyxis sp. PET50 TaxID=2976533 RepID=UPI0021B027EE|nr:hypothetical protein [Sphingopyxis sp. PET50]